MTKDSVTNFSNLINAYDGLKTEVSKVRNIWDSSRDNIDCPNRINRVSLIKLGYLLSDLESILEVLLKKKPISTQL